MSNLIHDVIEEALRYPSVVDADIVSEYCAGGGLVKFTWMISLPKRFEKAGRSASGVCDVEPVFFDIPADFPSHPPNITLRDDFPIDLPHIYPHRPGEPVPPCVSEIPLSELLHSQGLQGVLDAIDDWLKNAASDELHDPAQGWEPIRRVNSCGFMIMDTDTFRSHLTSNKNAVSYFQAMYQTFNSTVSMGRINEKIFGTANTSLKNMRVGRANLQDISETPVLVVSTSKAHEGYFAERVSIFSELLAFAEHFGLADALKHRYKYVVEAMVQSNHKHHQLRVDDFFVILAIKRPYFIIGLPTDIELLVYRVNVKLSSEGRLLDSSPCYPVMIQDLCSTSMLKAVSGTLPSRDTIHLSILGCGSLGSKLSLHLAKTGAYRFQFVDNGYMSMHNNARHGLIETNFIRQFVTNKANLLKESINQLGIQATSTPSDIRALDPSSDFHGRFHGGYIIDTTASLAVRHYLSHTPSTLPGRFIQTYLLNRSRMGVFLAEGENRNPRLDDINAYVYQLGVEVPCYSDNIYALDGPKSQHFGMGCDSYTTQMSDMEISLPATILAAQCHRYISSSELDHSNGWLSLVEIDDDQNSHVDHYTISSTEIITASNTYPWEVRLLGSVKEYINEQANAFPGRENGGILLGQYDELTHTVYVSGHLPAPPDTVRTATRFILGTKGVEEHLVKLAKRSNGAITFCGTWHSHPNSEPASMLDKDTLGHLQSKTSLPIVMLVHTGGRILRVE